MTEKNYVVNVKTKAGTIVTVRGDSAEELTNNIQAFTTASASDYVLALEEMFVSTQNPVAAAQAALGGSVISATPVTNSNGFNPVPPPVKAATGGAPAGAGTATRNCIHGVMTKRTGEGQWGPYKAFYCPTPKGTTDQCKPQYVKANDPDWATF